MIDFSTMKKFIYFPKVHERQKTPYVIFVLERWGPDWKGNPSAEELLKGKFSFYPLVRCRPYSDELWEACQELATRKTQLDEDFKILMEKGIGKHE